MLAGQDSANFAGFYGVYRAAKAEMSASEEMSIPHCHDLVIRITQSLGYGGYTIEVY